jgi:cobalt-zinc-cadmium efflux system membrane fusion protein
MIKLHPKPSLLLQNSKARTLARTTLWLLLISLGKPMLISSVEAAPAFVEATPALLKQLTITAIGAGQLSESLRLPARVEVNQRRLARIGATVSGRITEVSVGLGEEVRVGEDLATLNSPELGHAQSAYLKASSQVKLHHLSVERAKRLLAGDVIGSAELQERQSALGEAQVDQRAAADQLQIMGMKEKDLTRLDREKTIHSYASISSSLSGTVIERNITVGQVVQPADALYTVADLSHVWMVAEVPEQQAHWAKEGDAASAEVAALPGQHFEGKLIYVADLVNPETRTVTVRMDLPNAEHILKPQMLATLLIHKQGQEELLVPDSAVIREDNHDFVFVESSANRFELRPVELGQRDADQRRLLSGIRAGERVVTDGSFHLNSERMRKELE